MGISETEIANEELGNHYVINLAAYKKVKYKEKVLYIPLRWFIPEKGESQTKIGWCVCFILGMSLSALITLFLW
jgi:hypothetical protein